ncbi:MAG: hypothetical protein Q9174_005476, partial [Haloplaca sp. 1 TL-2023]
MMKIVLCFALLLRCVVIATSRDPASESLVLSTDSKSNKQQQILHPLPNLDNTIQTKPHDSDSPPLNPQILSITNTGLTPIPTTLPTHDNNRITHHTTNFFYTSLADTLSLAQTKATELDLHEVASDIETWLKAHPWKAAFYAAGAIGFFAPEILSLPALEALGFGITGVRAGSIAAKIQSVIGDVAAKSVFAIWQSARMGGYGVEYVNGGVRALVALRDAAVAGCDPLKDCGKELINGC